MLIHGRKNLQRGRGLLSFASSFIRKNLIPLAKSVLKAPVTKRILKKAKKSAINAGLNLVGDTIQGENVVESFKSNLKQAGKEIGNTVSNEVFTGDSRRSKGKKRKYPNRKAPPSRVKKKKKRKSFTSSDIFA